MPSLFSKRSRSASTPRPTTPASSSAHMAAAQAFLASKPSTSTLSTSAAAAALRTMSPKPTPIDQVQTKRMLNRQNSNSSVGSGTRGRSTGGMQRRTSMGSMTERTFRSPSPGGPSSPTGPAYSVGQDAPPVPRVPQTYTDDLPPVPKKPHRRSASMDTPTLRVGSPLSTRTASRVQPTTSGPPVSSLAAAAARKSSNPQSVPQLQRSDSQESRNSVNFSYPRGSRPTSPPPRSPLGPNNEAASAPPTNGISAAEVARIQHELSQTASTPVKKKKKRVDPSIVEGSHLHTGTMASKPIVTPLEPLPADYVPPAEPQPAKKAKKTPALTGESSYFPSHDNISDDTASAQRSTTGPEADQEDRAQRAPAGLMRYPSVVKEDWEGEQGATESSLVQGSAVEPVRLPSNNFAETVQPKKIVPEANMSRKIEDPISTPKHQSSVHSAVTSSSAKTSEPVKALSPMDRNASVGRGASISPSRSTRFSDRLSSDMTIGRKHEPPGRSISPAKSALKHSAGSDASPTDPRFPGRRGSSVTPSEASDLSDGMNSRKRSVRVSFDASTDAKEFTGASKDSSKNNRLGVGKSKSSTAEPDISDNEIEEGMKPRPALPSFGSVRRNERSTSPTTNAKSGADGIYSYSKSPSSSEASSIADPPTMNTSISSDHALGGLLYKDSQRHATSAPNAKQNSVATTRFAPAEGAGYESDTDSVYSDEGQPFGAAQTASKRLTQNIGNESGRRTSHDAIPAIAVQPATPGLDDSQPDWAVDVPGGFPGSGASSNVSLQDSKEDRSVPEHSTSTSDGLGLSKSAHEYTSLISHETLADSSPQQLTTITEEDSDAASVYSDAAEDLSDLEGDGFGSINAIVESPITSSPAQRVQPFLESPLASTSQRKTSDADRMASWNDAQSHWSGLAQRVRDNDQTPTMVTSTPVIAANSRSSEVPVPNKAALQPTLPTVGPVSKTKSPRVAMVPAQAAPLAPSLPASQQTPSTVVATKQMSPGKSSGPLRSSMRGQNEALAIGNKQRPASYAGPASNPRATLQKKHIPPVPSAQPLPRRFSNDSDSDSSFKRSRRKRQSVDGKYTMKRSMRSGHSEPAQPTLPAGRGGIRSLSPPLDRRPVSPVSTKPMRTTMRGSLDQSTPTLRAQPERKRSSSLFSRNREAKSPPRQSASSAILPSKLKSRLADSDDEDGPRPTHFKSRFADSSDEDEPTTFRPVRGIPRRKDDGDSTDLDDSSDDQAKKSKSNVAKKLTIIPPPVTQDVGSPPLSPTTAKKRGLWSRLRGKKKDEIPESSGLQPMLSQEKVDVATPQREPKISKNESKELKQLGFSSAAERDALIEQTRLKLEAAKEQPQTPVGSPGAPGKLQRRITPQRVFSDSWAPPKMPAAEDDRPQSSGVVESTSRPGIGSRQTTSEVTNGDGAVYGKTGKKKKFGLLRRAFGLTD